MIEKASDTVIRCPQPVAKSQTAARSPSVREETQSKKSVCVFCKKPITKEQRPAVTMGPGREAHMECFVKHDQDAKKPN